MSDVPGWTVLLTAFEPFDGHEVNASWAVVEEVASRWSGPARLETALLPVSFRGARQQLRAEIARVSPHLVVCLGEAGGRGAVGIERVAVNLIDARIPDDDGSAPVDVPVIAGAPTAFFSSLPVKACLVEALSTGVPTEVSGTAGTFVCNATFYALMHLLDRTPQVRGGFVHVPRLPSQVPSGAPGLDAESSARAVTAILTAALRGGADVRVSAGTEA